METKSDIGVYGMAVMGQNVALNIESKGYRVSVYNLENERTRDFAEERAGDRAIHPTYALPEFVDSLERPRRIMLLIRAGDPVDEVLDQLIPTLDEGDVVIDSGNSHYTDTRRRLLRAQQEGLLYVGCGISGGEHGALHGPALMPGGHRRGYELVEEIFTDVAAKTADGPCCAYMGPGPAGHYVKMVHNGIEYAHMQATADCFWLMNRASGLSPGEMGRRFERWNQDHHTYIVEITSEILGRRDPETDRPLIEVVLDEARQKGTGKWSVQAALDRGVAVPSISSAVEARLLSAVRGQRRDLEPLLGETPPAKNITEQGLKESLHLALLLAFAQGMSLLHVASREESMELNLAEVARVWKGGCVIRSDLLEPIEQALRDRPDLPTLLLDESIARRVRERIDALREVVAAAAASGLPVPTLSASLNYVEQYRSGRLPANLIQAQRDYFGAHTYRRVDREGDFHTDWHGIDTV